MSVNYRLHLFRKELDWNQGELADKMGVSRSAIANYEKEGYPIPEYAIIILELKFHLNREWLLNGKGAMRYSDDYINSKTIHMVNEHGEHYSNSHLVKIADELESLSKRLRIEISRNNQNRIAE